MKIVAQITATKAELARVKPHSRRRTILESRLRALVTRQIRSEIRRERRK